MRTFGKLIWTYFAPSIFFLIALNTLLGDPNEPISKSILIGPGSYQYEIAASFAVIGLALAYVFWRYQAKRSHSG